MITRYYTVITGNLQKMLIQSLFLVLICFNVASPAIITSPGMHRKDLGESCTFEWVVKGSFESYSLSNKSTGEAGALSSSAKHTRDKARGIISLTILNVQLWDAGNYTLSINAGTSTTIDNGALLFVYGIPKSVLLSQTSGSKPAIIEGSRVELTCALSSTSLPIQYRPKINYIWSVGDLSRLRNSSRGPADGDLLTGYSLKNDDSTLVIDSVQYRDRGISCCGQEDETPPSCSNPIRMHLHYRPRVSSRSPPSRRFHADVGEHVLLSLNVDARPAITSWNWTFVNTDGNHTSVPLDTSQDYNYVSFTPSSPAYYGVYTSTVFNSIGFTTETFQVLPPAPSDPPSQLEVVHATHEQILLQWNCMWFNGRKQTVSIQLKETASNIEIETRNTTVADSCYNQTETTRFQHKIRPETSYDVSIWSTNALGSSDVVKLSLTTPKRFKFVVSTKTIAINGTEATIYFSTSNGNVTLLTVTCCSESTGNCLSSRNYPIINDIYRVVYYGLPDGEAYLFDFVVYGGKSRAYYLTMVKGIRVSRTGGDDDESTAAPVLIPTSVLTVLLGISVLALVGGLLFFLVWKRRRSQSLPNLAIVQKKQQRELPNRPLPSPKWKSNVSVTKKVLRYSPDDEVPEYEIADSPKSPDHDKFYMYMTLNENLIRAKENQYS